MQVQVTFYGVLKQTTGVRAQTLDRQKQPARWVT